MKSLKQALRGFTLLEMMLVMVILSAIILGIATYSEQRMAQLRQDRAVLQIQQILNAGLAYYLNTTTWPISLTDDLQGIQGDATHQGGYLPGPSNTVHIYNPWGGTYVIGHSSTTSAPNALFAVCTTISAGAATPTVMNILAGRLPMAYVVDGDHSADCATSTIPTATPCVGTSCTLIATVNVPGQNLNNARSVNFAGVYHHGACVAEPKCPANMTPQILVAPVSVSGMVNNPSEIYPISSFTAYVVAGGAVTSPGPVKCTGDTNTTACPASTGPNDKYWRVCLQIITQNGPVVYNDPTGKDAATILAITRCAPYKEDTTPTVSGSPISVFEY
jgi:prepilin-type N-terminal cleavage/methylation domain-containing protein